MKTETSLSRPSWPSCQKKVSQMASLNTFMRGVGIALVVGSMRAFVVLPDRCIVAFAIGCFLLLESWSNNPHP